MATSHPQNSSSTTTCFRIAIIEKIHNVEKNIDEIIDQISINETRLQRIPPMTLEEFLRDNKLYRIKRRLKNYYEHRIYKARNHLEKEVEKLERLKNYFEEYEKTRWANLLPKEIYEKFYPRNNV